MHQNPILIFKAPASVFLLSSRPETRPLRRFLVGAEVGNYRTPGAVPVAVTVVMVVDKVCNNDIVTAAGDNDDDNDNDDVDVDEVVNCDEAVMVIRGLTGLLCL